MLMPKAMGACWGADTNAKLDDPGLDRLKSTPLPNGKPIEFLFRYVSLHLPPSPADITTPERDKILRRFPLGLVQHVLNPGWVATNDNGKALGAAAAAHAKLVGYPGGCHLGVDMEGIHDVGQPVLDFLAAWIAEAHAAGFRVVVYWGYAFQVDPAKVVALLGPEDVFWSDYGQHAPPPGAGFVVRQHAQVTVAGIGVDPDEDTGTDQRGNALVLMVDADPTAGGDGDPTATATEERAAA